MDVTNSPLNKRALTYRITEVRNARCAGLDYVITTITVMCYEAPLLELSESFGARGLDWRAR